MQRTVRPGAGRSQMSSADITWLLPKILVLSIRLVQACSHGGGRDLREQAQLYKRQTCRLL